MKLLLHACCAPCSEYCVDTLRKENIEPTMLWYNPNIHPYEEYVLRRDSFVKYCENHNLEFIMIDKYGLDEFCKNVSDNIDARCTNYCYPVRLNKVFEMAKEKGFDTVSTTLLYSIYQKHDFIKNYMENKSKETGIEVLYRDFRVGFWVGHEMAIEDGLYMQKYCGCVFSEEDAALTHKMKMPPLPDGFEFIEVKRNEVIRKEKEDKEKFMDLLLEADPNESLVKEYLDKGDLYSLYYKDELASVAVVLEIDSDTVELKNIATKEEYRGRGFGKKLLKSLFGNYKQKYKKMIVGTTENNIPFYVKQGFDKFEKRVDNFFIDNYGDDLYDGNLHCKDIHYYSKILNKQ